MLSAFYLASIDALSNGPRGDHVAFYLASIDALSNGPRGDHVVHNSLTEWFGNVMQLHKLSDTVQHVVVAAGGRVHLLEDGRHVTENGSVQESWGETRGEISLRELHTNANWRCYVVVVVFVFVCSYTRHALHMPCHTLTSHNIVTTDSGLYTRNPFILVHNLNQFNFNFDICRWHYYCCIVGKFKWPVVCKNQPLCLPASVLRTVPFLFHYLLSYTRLTSNWLRHILFGWSFSRVTELAKASAHPFSPVMQMSTGWRGQPTANTAWFLGSCGFTTAVSSFLHCLHFLSDQLYFKMKIIL